MKRLLPVLSIISVFVGVSIAIYAFHSGFGQSGTEAESIGITVDTTGHNGIGLDEKRVSYAINDASDDVTNALHSDSTDTLLQGAYSMDIAPVEFSGSFVESLDGDLIAEESSPADGSYFASYGLQATGNISSANRMNYLVSSSARSNGPRNSSAGSAAISGVSSGGGGNASANGGGGDSEATEEPQIVSLLDEEDEELDILTEEGEELSIPADPTVYANASAPKPVPEPTTLLLLGSGLLGMFSLGRKKLLSKE